MTDDDYLIDDIIAGEDLDELETAAMPNAKAIRITALRRLERLGQQDALRAVITTPPAPGEQIHILGASTFDFWTWVPTMIDWLGHSDMLYCATWVANRTCVQELFELWDAGRIGQVHYLTGRYFKSRDTAVYNTLLDGIRTRRGRVRVCDNHAKVLLLNHGPHYLTVEGSANMTKNPRIEQYVITNDQALHQFHAAWMEEILAAP